MHLFPAAFIPFSFPGEDLLSLNASIFFLTFDSRFTQIFKIRNGYRMHNVRNRQDLFSHMVITFSNDHSKHILLICSYGSMEAQIILCLSGCKGHQASYKTQMFSQSVTCGGNISSVGANFDFSIMTTHFCFIFSVINCSPLGVVYADEMPSTLQAYALCRHFLCLSVQCMMAASSQLKAIISKLIKVILNVILNAPD